MDDLNQLFQNARAVGARLKQARDPGGAAAAAGVVGGRGFGGGVPIRDMQGLLAEAARLADRGERVEGDIAAMMGPVAQAAHFDAPLIADA